uniref:Reverse transcriptase domain-containing protein n=1 Tax=Tanacetum cinerariifolium TaxID=118510 RepID=A0A699GXI5_TANCI|nr:reverse transcriptase domain-containing protein [Tanacetum cinerariifolium]
MKSIMDEVQINSSQSIAQIPPPLEEFSVDMTMHDQILSQFHHGIVGSSLLSFYLGLLFPKGFTKSQSPNSFKLGDENEVFDPGSITINGRLKSLNEILPKIKPKLQLNELSELRDQAYENSFIYKERTKKLHGDKIKNRIFNVGDQVLLFNSRLKIFSGKLKSRWSGPFTIAEIYSYGTAKLIHPDGCNFKVSCHRLKHYHGGDLPPLEIPDVTNFPKEK